MAKARPRFGLRVQLVLALVLLSAASVAAVGAFSYLATSHRLRGEIDSSIDSYADRLSDPDLRSADAACTPGSEGEHDNAGGDSGGGELPQALITCVGRDGKVLASNLTDKVGERPATPIVETQPDHPRTQELDGRTARVLTVRLADGRVIRVGRSLTETEEVLDTLRNRTIVVGLLVVLGAGIVGWVVAQAVARPVERLTRTAEAVTDSGGLATDVPTGGGIAEVSRLADAFNAMLTRLRRSNDLQQQLVQDAGHELRTPITSLRANVDTLRRHPELEGPRRDSLLADLDSETRELTALVDELVAVASDRFDQEPEQVVQLDEIARQVVDRSRRRTGRSIEVTTEPTSVLGRAGQLQRAVGNLVENALKFGPADTPIEVDVRDGRVSVRDRGPGIAPEDLPHVFERFYRATSARSLPGSGLGLSIVQQVTEDCGGTATAANRPGGGAELVMDIPTAPPL